MICYPVFLSLRFDVNLVSSIQLRLLGIKMKIVLLDAQTLGDSDLSLFEQLGEFSAYPFTSNQQILAHIADNEVIITNKVMIDRAVIKANPQLKLICIAATGTNNVDLLAAQEAGVTVKNVSGYSTESVAQSTFSMLLKEIESCSRYSNSAIGFRSIESSSHPVNRRTFNLFHSLNGSKSILFSGLYDNDRRSTPLFTPNCSKSTSFN